MIGYMLSLSTDFGLRFRRDFSEFVKLRKVSAPTYLARAMSQPYLRRLSEGGHFP